MVPSRLAQLNALPWSCASHRYTALAMVIWGGGGASPCGPSCSPFMGLHFCAQDGSLPHGKGTTFKVFSWHKWSFFILIYLPWGCISLWGLPHQSSTDHVAFKTDIYFLTILESRSLRSKCQQGWFLPQSLSLAHRWPPTRCLHMGLPLCVPVFQSPLCVEVPVMLD